MADKILLHLTSITNTDSIANFGMHYTGDGENWERHLKTYNLSISMCAVGMLKTGFPFSYTSNMEARRVGGELDAEHLGTNQDIKVRVTLLTKGNLSNSSN